MKHCDETFLALCWCAVHSGWMRAGPKPVQGNGPRHDGVGGLALAGVIAPFVFVAALLKSNLSIYQVHNNGA